jgi:hypothetical protein
MNREHIYFFQGNNDETNENIKRQLTKIVKKDFYIENEIINVERLKKIEDIKKYCYTFESVEKMQIAEMEDGVYNLKQIRKIKDDENVLFKFENKQLIYLENYLKTLISARKYIFILIEFYTHINHVLQILVKNNIVFNNININNIVIDRFETPLLCNFKFSIDISNHHINNYIKQFFFSYDTHYLSWAPELHILSYVISNKSESLSMFNIETIINDTITNNYLLQTFGTTIVNQFKNDGLAYFKKYTNKSYEYILQDILQYYYTWDNYALSILYLQMLIGLHKKIQKNNKFIIIFMRLLVDNINVNPQKRLNLQDTIDKFNKLCLSIGRENYIDLVHSL